LSGYTKTTKTQQGWKIFSFLAVVQHAIHAAMSVLLYNLSFILVLLFFMGANGEGFNRERCYAKVQSMLSEGLLAANDTAFYRDDGGTIHSKPERPVLTLNKCNSICGAEYGWYVDIGPRLSTWLIPVFLLLSNMEVSPLDKRRYLMIIHLLGDPIDSLWSLLSKLEAWSRCHHLAVKLCDPADKVQVRNVATVLGGFEDLVGFYDNPDEVFMKLKSWSIAEGQHFDLLVSRASQQLADSRTDERLRTLLATALYVYQLVSAFVTTVGGGSTSPPGGRIGITMFMTWIVPSILVSNAIGGFTSRRTCYSILEGFVQDATNRRDAWHILQQAAPSLKYYQSVHDYFDSLAWSGAVYSYRPKKVLAFTSGSRDISPSLLLFLAIVPVATSSLIASLILWNTPPIGINCRNILIFVITALVFLSALCTQVSSSFLSGARHWHIMLVKHSLLAIPSVVLIFLACAGRFNSCWCWSGVFSLGAKARVPLNATPEFAAYDKTTYPILVAVCLTIQCATSVGMIWVGWRGWNLMRWSEEEKKAGWGASRGPVQNTS
jgi:hypothetical protein